MWLSWKLVEGPRGDRRIQPINVDTGEELEGVTAVSLSAALDDCETLTMTLTALVGRPAEDVGKPYERPVAAVPVLRRSVPCRAMTCVGNYQSIDWKEGKQMDNGKEVVEEGAHE